MPQIQRKHSSTCACQWTWHIKYIDNYLYLEYGQYVYVCKRDPQRAHGKCVWWKTISQFQKVLQQNKLALPHCNMHEQVGFTCYTISGTTNNTTAWRVLFRATRVLLRLKQEQIPKTQRKLGAGMWNHWRSMQSLWGQQPAHQQSTNR